MAIKKKEVVKILEDIINRLDEVMTDSLIISDHDEVGYKAVDFDNDMDDETDPIETALLIAENRINEVTQALSEEIDNMRRLLERIEEGVV